MSNLYRQHGDNWAHDSSVEDLPVDRIDNFPLISNLMEEMAKVVHGSNEKARKGLGLDETLKYCRMVFEGVTGLEYSERYLIID